MVSINQLTDMIMLIANKKLNPSHIDGTLSVRGRNSDNRLIKDKLGWQLSMLCKEGLKNTFDWFKKYYLKNNH